MLGPTIAKTAAVGAKAAPGVLGHLGPFGKLIGALEHAEGWLAHTIWSIFTFLVGCVVQLAVTVLILLAIIAGLVVFMVRGHH